MTGRDEHLDGCPSGDFGPCDCDTVVSSGEAQIKRAAKEAGLINRVYRSEGDLWTDSPINLSKFVRFLALQPYVVGSAQHPTGYDDHPISTEEYFRGTLKVIAHWAEVDLSAEWESGLRGIIKSMTDAAREVLSAHPERRTYPRAASAEPLTDAAGPVVSVARPNRGLDSLDGGHQSDGLTPADDKFKLVYIKRWRALFKVPSSIADEVRDTLNAETAAHSPAEVEKPPGFDPEKNYTNHLSVMIDAIGHEAMGKVKAALNIAGYTICKGDPSETGWELKRVKAENEQLRAQVEQEIQNWKVRNKAACRAERALIGAGWTLEAGAEEWKPPLGPSASPLLDRITQLEAQVENAAARDVLAERQRQKDKEGWTIEHDDSHISAEMAMAAAVYALTSFLDTEHSLSMAFTRYWPWDRSWFKPAGGRRDLVRAGALILAEIERLDRREHTSTVREGK